MNTLPKSAALRTLGLPSGDHWVRFHVEEEFISFEVAGSVPEVADLQKPRRPTGFVKAWGGTARRINDLGDAWLEHIHRKHLR